MINNPNTEIKDKLTKVCVCKAIAKSKIKDSIRNGALTLESVKNETGASSGACKGSRCNETILKLIEEFKNGQWK